MQELIAKLVQLYGPEKAQQMLTEAQQRWKQPHDNAADQWAQLQSQQRGWNKVAPEVNPPLTLEQRIEQLRQQQMGYPAAMTAREPYNSGENLMMDRVLAKRRM